MSRGQAYESPQQRRLRTDRAALDRLQAESTILRFSAQGTPATRYLVTFLGRSLAREHGKVVPRAEHQVEIRLGSSYPRTMPELRWLTPIYHPNISEIGLVCLGGYGTHWVPSLQLDELCTMLWDMARFHNYDLRSPYNRDAALWAANQTTFTFPIDPRPLRDQPAAPPPRATLGAAPARVSPAEATEFVLLPDGPSPASPPLPPRREEVPEVLFLD